MPILPVTLAATIQALTFASVAPVAGPQSVAKPSAVAPVSGRSWVYFADKGFANDAAEQSAIAALAGTYNPRAVERRKLRRTDPGLFDARDLPVSDTYIAQI